MASLEGHCEVVRKLLEAESDVNIENEVGLSYSILMTVSVLITVYIYREEPQHYTLPVRRVIWT